MTPQELDALVENKEAFSAYVYTPLEEAFAELERRAEDPKLAKYVESQLVHGVPENLKDKKSLVLFRHIATPNYEISRYMGIADAYPEYNTIILEYLDDQFNDRNENKYFLGKLRFQKGHDKNNNPIFEHEMLINFNESNVKPLSSLSTKWGQSLVDFHHEMFEKRFSVFENCHHDLSSWLHTYGKSAKEYYKPFLSLFLKDAILFENFLTNKKEGTFTRSVILPIFEEIVRESGHKPLIVALEPTHIEEDHFWLSYPLDWKGHIDKKKSNPHI